MKNILMAFLAAGFLSVGLSSGAKAQSFYVDPWYPTYNYSTGYYNPYYGNYLGYQGGFYWPNSASYYDRHYGWRDFDRHYYYGYGNAAGRLIGDILDLVF